MSLEKCEKKVPNIILGEDKAVDVKLKNINPPKDPIDLTAATEIEAIFLNADNTYLVKKLSTMGIALISGPGGHFQILLSVSETALLAPSAVGSYSDIEINFTIASKKTIVILAQSVLCQERRYPGA